jgi:hypothetical protein
MATVAIAISKTIALMEWHNVISITITILYIHTNDDGILRESGVKLRQSQASI